jgi:hypothetical protein
MSIAAMTVVNVALIAFGRVDGVMDTDGRGGESWRLAR